MKNFLPVCLLIWCLGHSIYAQPTKHVVLISVDGFRPDFYEDPSWGMVNLRQMMQEGAYAEGVNSIFPTVTFPNHTTLITGVKSAKHGINYNEPFRANTQDGEWYWYYKAIKSPTLWDAASKAGLVTASVNWPVSVGAPVDYNVPIIKKKGISRVQAIGEYCVPKGILEELQSKATGKLEDIDFNMTSDYLVLDENIARMSAYIIRKYKPSLITLRLSCVDHCEHLDGRDGRAVRRAVSGVDRALRTIMESIERSGLKENTTVIVTGDHGFVDRHTMIAPNVWLTQAGLIENLETGEWKARFHTTGGSAFLILKDRGDKKTIEKINVMLEQLPEKYKHLFRVVRRNELDEKGAAPEAELALAAVKGVAFSSALHGEVIKPGEGGTHGYFPDFPEIQTGFVISGAGIKKGTVIPVMSTEDVAPIIAALLDISFDTADGILFPGILDK